MTSDQMGKDRDMLSSNSACTWLCEFKIRHFSIPLGTNFTSMPISRLRFWNNSLKDKFWWPSLASPPLPHQMSGKAIWAFHSNMLEDRERNTNRTEREIHWKHPVYVFLNRIEGSHSNTREGEEDKKKPFIGFRLPVDNRKVSEGVFV